MVIGLTCTSVLMRAGSVWQHTQTFHGGLLTRPRVCPSGELNMLYVAISDT
jgi:hypothetical protein